ncbi:MAG: hypothetical protein H3C34_22450 [Caldilineaceae bacterium]|nr:hypothetical protein [Caldilineaceae bacterium]
MKLHRIWLAGILISYLILAIYQLGLPGLHYDEAREAGLNAMEILAGTPINAYREAGLTIAGRTYPVMVQDYIGALNVYLALPFLAVTGVGVPNLRLLPVVTGLVVLLLVERTVSEWVTWHAQRSARQVSNAKHEWHGTGLTLSGLVAATLLALSPSFVFWSRQGIFVTNLTEPFVFLSLWQGIRWLRTGANRALLMAALAASLAIYAKLLALWIVGPFVVLAGGWWLWQRWHLVDTAPRLSWRMAGAVLAAFLAPLTPLLLFNLETGGTLASIGANLENSYYGVANADVAENLSIRVAQLLQVLRGDQFWYLGGAYANSLAPWLAAVALAAGLWRRWRVLLPPLLLLAGALAASLFTVSALFVTHYALLQPLCLAIAGLGLSVWLDDDARIYPTTTAGTTMEPGRITSRRLANVPSLVASALFVTWSLVDLSNSVLYHTALSRSGGLADHSDASYHLAYHLRYNGMGAPVALDWGMDAPVRFLSQGTVTPIEIFGYGSPAAPDEDFEARLTEFLGNLDNVYLLHAPGFTVFQGRRERFLAAAAARGLTPELEKQFSQRDGVPVFEIWKVLP